MEALREIIAGSKLAEVIDLPEQLKTSVLEVIVLPVSKEKEVEKNQSFNLEDLPKHKMGKEFSPLDRENIYTDER